MNVENVLAIRIDENTDEVHMDFEEYDNMTKQIKKNQADIKELQIILSKAMSN